MTTPARTRDAVIVQILVDWEFVDESGGWALAGEASRAATTLEQHLLRRQVLDAAQAAQLAAELRWRTSTTPLLTRYRIDRLLGRGAFAVVYQAFDRRTERTVALKIVSIRNEPQRGRRFVREARAVARLEHPNIIRVHDVGVDEGCLYLAMDCIEGRHFGQLIDDRNGARALLPILETVARAVGYAHDRGVVHRDLKPNNILIAADGRPIVADFGMARLDDPDLSALTQEGVAVGTPAYMAPEQVSGDRERISGRTDVHALGNLLYRILTGRPPFPATSKVALFSQIVISRIDPPRAIDPEIPEALERLALEALDLEPDRRPTAAEFARRLGDAIGQRRPRLARATGPRLRRRWLVAGLIGLGACLGALLVGTRRSEPETSVEARAAQLFETVERLRERYGDDPAFEEDLIAAYQEIVDSHPGTEAARRSQEILDQLAARPAPRPPTDGRIVPVFGGASILCTIDDRAVEVEIEIDLSNREAIERAFSTFPEGARFVAGHLDLGAPERGRGGSLLVLRGHWKRPLTIEARFGLDGRQAVCGVHYGDYRVLRIPDHPPDGRPGVAFFVGQGVPRSSRSLGEAGAIDALDLRVRVGSVEHVIEVAEDDGAPVELVVREGSESGGAIAIRWERVRVRLERLFVRGVLDPTSVGPE